jgi:hypothetical protein
MTTAIHKTTLRNAALLVAFLLASLFAFAGEKKLSPELDARTGQPGNAHQLVDVIIQFRPGTQLPKKIAHMLDLGPSTERALM